MTYGNLQLDAEERFHALLDNLGSRLARMLPATFKPRRRIRRPAQQRSHRGRRIFAFYRRITRLPDKRELMWWKYGALACGAAVAILCVS